MSCWGLSRGVAVERFPLAASLAMGEKPVCLGRGNLEAVDLGRIARVRPFSSPVKVAKVSSREALESAW